MKDQNADHGTETIRAMIEAFEIIRWIGGGFCGAETIIINDPAEARRWLSDPAAAEADEWGVSVGTLTAWKAAEGAAECGAPTSRGRPCRNVVATGLQPRAWAAVHHVRRCARHLEKEVQQLTGSDAPAHPTSGDG